MLVSVTAIVVFIMMILLMVTSSTSHRLTMVISESPSSFVVMTASISVTDTGLVTDITETPLLTSVIVVAFEAWAGLFCTCSLPFLQ